MTPKVTPLRQRPTEGRRVVELFAGVGGFRLGLEGVPAEWRGDFSDHGGSGWQVVWSNQWEPSTKVQYASDCYVQRFGERGHSNEDIGKVVAETPHVIPEHDLLVGGFPCQDYSVAKVLSQSAGIEGKKGVLWWQIYEILQMRRPKHLILENVDRLLKSPASQRGRDFAIILWCLHHLGYLVEWRVVNAADYGLAQRRRRVFIVGTLIDSDSNVDLNSLLFEEGAVANAFPIEPRLGANPLDMTRYTGKGRSTDAQLVELTKSFGTGDIKSRFRTAGVSWGGQVLTLDADPVRETAMTLDEVLIPDSEVPEEFFIDDAHLDKWRYLKGSKKQERNGRDGFVYYYNEGPVAFPDPLDRPSRTILTGEGGATASRFKHVVETPSGKLRRLIPVELERLNGFPDEWTDTGMPDARRAFMMGNALVVGLVQRIGNALSNANAQPVEESASTTA
ncbi:MAG: DNA (cytosine-5-)-methyltransferase [Actinobacteria bacterium]|nr:DNA (cytosine-5-)-methyltransferase [Actinomycetota bacterium]